MTCPDCENTTWTIRMADGVAEIEAFGKTEVQECRECGYTESKWNEEWED